VVERELIGGECAYWACIPSKTLLRGPEARAAAGRVAGLSAPPLEWPGLRDYRDYMIRHLDDSAQVRGYQQAGATVIKGAARLAGPGKVQAGGELLQADHIVIATGSQPRRPAVEGLDGVRVWTNREATTVRDIPARVLLVGGGAVGTELGQFFARMGAQTTIVQRAGRLIDREDPRVGMLAAQALVADGITVRTGRTVTHAQPTTGGGAVVTLYDGTEVESDVIILGAGPAQHLWPRAGGRRPPARPGRGHPGRRALPGRAGPVGTGRCHRRRPVHPRRQLPGPRCRRQHPQPPARRLL
jgi:dihydrolipoamide dehydrogenase